MRWVRHVVSKSKTLGVLRAEKDKAGRLGERIILSLATKDGEYLLGREDIRLVEKYLDMFALLLLLSRFVSLGTGDTRVTLTRDERGSGEVIV
jgi:hypothetical protein